MSRFSAIVARPSKGHYWENLESYEVTAETERYADDVYLVPRGYEKLPRWGEIEFENCYDPFVDEPGLFRIFSQLPSSPESILAFANKYGDLNRIEVLTEDGGLSLSTWQREIREMRELVAESDRLIAPLRSARAQTKRMEDIEGFVYPIVAPIQVTMMTTVRNSIVCLCANTLCLLDAMKLQLVESVIDQKTYRTCALCSKPIELTPGVNRSDRKYCSNNCRVKACQGREKRAVKMHKEGSKVAAIAKALGSDVKTIKNWVQGTSRKE